MQEEIKGRKKSIVLKLYQQYCKDNNYEAVSRNTLWSKLVYVDDEAYKYRACALFFEWAEGVAYKSMKEKYRYYKKYCTTYGYKALDYADAYSHKARNVEEPIAA